MSSGTHDRHRAWPESSASPSAPKRRYNMLFTGHMDTVFGADHAFQAMRWLEPGVLNGPGVADMKGGIAVMLAALEGDRGVPAGQRGSAMMSFSIRTRRSGRSARQTSLPAPQQGKRAALTYEPSALPDGTFAGARPGSGNFSFTVTGKSAHAGRNPAGRAQCAGRRCRPCAPTQGRDARRAVGQSRADRRGKPEQCCPRPCRAAGQFAATHASRTRPPREGLIESGGRDRSSRRDTTSPSHVARSLRAPAQADDPRARGNCSGWSNRPVPTLASRSLGARPAGYATATISPPAGCP